MKTSLQTRGESQVDQIVRLARRHLGMDVAFVARFVDGKQVYRALAGDAASFDMTLGDGPALQDTYCTRMVRGDIPRVIPDSEGDSRVRHLPATAEGSVRSYIGVPLRLPDGELYGSFCAVSTAVQPDLRQRDADFLAMLGEILAEQLASETRHQASHAALRTLIDTRSLSIALQPVVDLLTGSPVGMEALARFPAGIGSPDVAFAAAEQVGLRSELETLAVERAFELLPLLGAGQHLAVNLSPDVAMQFALTPPTDVPLDRLVVEITEHAAVESYVAIRDRLRPLRDLGTQLAIDDAGAGFASLRHVVELRPDIIKIDRSLVQGIDADVARRSALTTFVLLALDTGGTVVAEGVETKEELATVAALGVDAAQGYYLARPSTDLAEVARWASGAPLI